MSDVGSYSDILFSFILLFCREKSQHVSFVIWISVCNSLCLPWADTSLSSRDAPYDENHNYLVRSQCKIFLC